MEEVLQFASQVESIRTLKDGSLKVVLETQELNADHKAKLFEFGSEEIWTAFKRVPMDLQDIKVDMPDPEFKGKKSPSERLHDIIFVLWKKKYSERYTDFDDFYKKKMNQICEEIKSKID